MNGSPTQDAAPVKNANASAKKAENPAAKAEGEKEEEIVDSEESGDEMEDLIKKAARYSLDVASGSVAEKGKRPTMEDCHITIDFCEYKDSSKLSDTGGGNNVNKTDIGFYGIYDGHRGSKAAEYCKEAGLHNEVLGILAPRLNNYTNQEKEADQELIKLLTNSFIEFDGKLLTVAKGRGPGSEGKSDLECELLAWDDGATAAVAIVSRAHKLLIVANLGDAEIILARRKKSKEGANKCIMLSEKHVPNNDSERNRIMSEGGLVINGRVAGKLAVARAFGDLEFKTNSKPEDGVHVGKLISDVPTVKVVHLTPRDNFFIIGCDGVWEKMQHQKSIDIVTEALKNGHSPEESAKILVENSLEAGSLDNISATVVVLKWTSPRQ